MFKFSPAVGIGDQFCGIPVIRISISQSPMSTERGTFAIDESLSAPTPLRLFRLHVSSDIPSDGSDAFGIHFLGRLFPEREMLPSATIFPSYSNCDNT